MDDLIVSDTISDNEKEILSAAKSELNKHRNDEAVAAKLKSQLSLLAMKKKLSASVVPFFTELSQLYLGYGRRGNISLTPMF